MPVSVLSIKDQGQWQSIPYNCSDSNSKWTRCVKARFVQIQEELETIFPSIIIWIFAIGGETRSRRDRWDFEKFQFQDLLPSDNHFRPHCLVPDHVLRTYQILKLSHAQAMRAGYGFISTHSRTDPASDIALVRLIYRSAPDFLYFDGDPMNF